MGRDTGQYGNFMVRSRGNYLLKVLFTHGCMNKYHKLRVRKMHKNRTVEKKNKGEIFILIRGENKAHTLRNMGRSALYGVPDFHLDFAL